MAKTAKNDLPPYIRYDMKRLLLGLMLLVTAGAASTASAAWTVEGENSARTLYVDRATIRRNGDFVKMWNLFDFKNATMNGGKSTLSSRSHSEYDCNAEKSRFLSFTLFSGQMGNGTATYTDNKTEEWIPIAPESGDELLWKIACGKK